MTNKKWEFVGSVLRHIEGGIAQSYVKQVGEVLGLQVRFVPSPLIGHYGVEIKGDMRKRVSFTRTIWKN